MPIRAGSGSDRALGAVDYRYSLPWWQTLICLPDQPDKTLVSKEGRLLYDFLGRFEERDALEFYNFGVTLEPDVVNGSTWIRQQTLSARVPIVQTWKDSAGVEILEEAFVLTPAPNQRAASPRLVRGADEMRWLRFEGWAKPARPAAFVFTGADSVKHNAILRYGIAVSPGAAMNIIFGLCEGKHEERGQRLLVLEVEGDESRTVDPVKEFGANQPGLCRFAGRDANRDGMIDLSVSTPKDAPDRQGMLNALWVFEGEAPDDETIITGKANDQAYAWSPGRMIPESRAVVLVTMKNRTAAPVTRQPTLRVVTAGPVSRSAGGGVTVADSTLVSASASLELAPSTDSMKETVLRLPPLALAPGESREVVFTIDRHAVQPAAPLTVAQARAAREAARQWWEKSDLPFEAIQVPDAELQAMIESSVRNIWQVRDIKQGRPSFQVGPTVYRGLWVADGAFLLECATLLGRAQDARAGIEYVLAHQKADGSFGIMSRYWKENGLVLWTATRHALLTQDQEWLRGHWPAIQRVVQAIRRLREETAGDPAALNHRLLPGGHVDGGIANRDAPEFSNSYWCLAGLKAAIAAAHWLGDAASAADWQNEYDDFYRTLRSAMQRDARQDIHGNTYVPIMMGNAGEHSPAKGQWTFCHAVYPGQVFPPDDPLVQGQLAMMRATKVQGMVLDTGWIRDGLWPYFASFYGHAWLWQGDGREAAHALYDFARHACPTRVWKEEQKPLGTAERSEGDMPHNWASAEFIRLVTHLLELDRGDELHLLEGFPREWAGPGMVTHLDGILTPFGPLRLEVRLAANGRKATVKVAKLARAPARLVLHLAGLTGETRTVELPVDRDVSQVFSIEDI